jgi:phosphomannomutase
MNRVVVTQAAAGFAAWLTAKGLLGGKVLIGYDARHNSDVFARDTAEVLAGAGFQALLTAAPTPTPVVAFGIKHFGCVAAVVVTASHNPAADNGYKVYLGDGSQIIPPTDTEIASAIAIVAAHPLSDIPHSAAYSLVGSELVDAYSARVAQLVNPTPDVEIPGIANLKWAYTPMHGVGGHVIRQVAAQIGFPTAAVVAAQAQPDPDFPTVAFPNPEEPGAMDMVIALAQETGADIAVATDPDADRCAVAAPIAGVWRRLTGDELGALLGDYVIRRGTPGRFANSLVSGTLLSDIAAANGREFRTTLTGFKWIGRVPDLAFGYEEAIGYCCDSHFTPDKDGISASLLVLRLVSELKAAGMTIADRLDEIERTYGVHSTTQVSIRVRDLSLIAQLMANLRANPPATLGGEPVQVTDLSAPGGALPPTDGVEFTGASIHAVARPSGTEPKLKCYLEARRPVSESKADLVAARAAAKVTLDALWTDLAQALGYQE